ncbi:hypothetical protein B296_00004590 [Ensete ventricosum]|uniref:Beta-galactosidase beta-sandwich domain-containing protein n=1 Tax=Ensete ventricosum TaxID=4639 RepID=A0A427B2L5_ENSVE|nr:hypothetical protein B296_00004590 [Ensete ventricosum]
MLLGVEGCLIDLLKTMLLLLLVFSKGEEAFTTITWYNPLYANMPLDVANDFSFLVEQILVGQLVVPYKQLVMIMMLRLTNMVCETCGFSTASQPKWGHLKDLHAAIKLCEPALVAAHIYSSGFVDTRKSIPQNVSICSAFLANIDERKTVTVQIFGGSYSLPPWSVSILPDCKHVVFNTAKVGFPDPGSKMFV